MCYNMVQIPTNHYQPLKGECMATRAEFQAQNRQKAEEFVKQVEELRTTKNLSVQAACEELKSNVSRYYNNLTALGRRTKGKTKTKKKVVLKRKYQRRALLTNGVVPVQQRSAGGFIETPRIANQSGAERQVIFFSGPESLAALLVQTLQNRQ